MSLPSIGLALHPLARGAPIFPSGIQTGNVQCRPEAKLVPDFAEISQFELPFDQAFAPLDAFSLSQ